MPRKIICRALTGPTASGKTGLALKLAEEMGWEIICMDSMQVYRRMDIGTAKPTPAEQEMVPHHLIDIREPYESFSVSDYVLEAEKKISELAGRGKDFLMVGGTGLYLSALMHPMGMGGVPANETLREELNAIAAVPGGPAELHRRLESLDPATAARLPVNDIRRTIRAIEVTEMTGIPFSMQPDRSTGSGYEWKTVSTAMDRHILYERINRRVNEMIEAGLPDEVERLLQEGVPENAQSMAAIGYKEMIPYIRGQYSLEESADAIRTGSRHYAKRQMTFLRREPAVRYADVMRPDAYEEVRRLLV